MPCEKCSQIADRLNSYTATLNALLCILEEKKIISFKELHRYVMLCVARMDQMEVETKDELKAKLAEVFREINKES